MRVRVLAGGRQFLCLGWAPIRPHTVEQNALVRELSGVAGVIHLFRAWPTADSENGDQEDDPRQPGRCGEPDQPPWNPVQVREWNAHCDPEPPKKIRDREEQSGGDRRDEELSRGPGSGPETGASRAPPGVDKTARSVAEQLGSMTWRVTRARDRFINHDSRDHKQPERGPRRRSGRLRGLVSRPWSPFHGSRVRPL